MITASTTAAIYDYCQLPPVLRQHMLRVTKAGRWILKHWVGPDFDQSLYIHALLVHDLGNLAKFDLTPTATVRLLPLENIEEWQQIQQDFIAKYGKNADAATLKLIDELKLPRANDLIELIGGHSPTRLADAVQQSNWAQKLLDYTDFRVGPFGILSLDERFADLTNRYQYRTKEWGDPEWIQTQLNLFKQLESQIAAQLNTAITDLSDDAILEWSDADILAIPWTDTLDQI
jgi:hypothetical protein